MIVETLRLFYHHQIQTKTVGIYFKHTNYNITYDIDIIGLLNKFKP